MQEIVIGMAHRGRLNVLVNTLGKMPAGPVRRVRPHRPEDLPRRRREVPPGLLERRPDPSGPVHLSPGVQPSHLEIVNPVVEGSVKARLDRRGDTPGARCCRCSCTATPAFAGQGVVMETLALAQTRGYYTGGTVHIVINNQIGFTTSDPRDSARRCTAPTSSR